VHACIRLCVSTAAWQQHRAHTQLCLCARSVRFWDLATFRCVRKCDGHEDAVRVVAVGPGGTVFSGSYDGSIGVW